jgi:hypothetical protein
VAGLLPEDAPLSTLRVITCSRRWLDEQMQAAQEGGQAAPQGLQPERRRSSSSGSRQSPRHVKVEGIEVATVVFRAGAWGDPGGLAWHCNAL